MTPAADLPPSSGQHLATISHAGRFWDVYLEFDDDLRHPEYFRALLAYSPADRAEGEKLLRTIGRGIGQKRAKVLGMPKVIVKFEINVPKPSGVADRREVLPRGRWEIGRRRHGPSPSSRPPPGFSATPLSAESPRLSECPSRTSRTCNGSAPVPG
jgi:hypothetical protein